MLDRVARHLAGVARRPCRDNDDFVHLPQELRVNAHFIEFEVSGVHPSAQRFGDGGRPFVDFFVHEGGVAALDRGGRVPIHGETASLGGRTGKIIKLDAVGLEHHHGVLLNLQGLTGFGNKGGNIGAEEVLPLAQPDDEGRVTTRGHHIAASIEGHEGEGPFELRGEAKHGVFQIAGFFQVQRQAVRRDFGIRLGDGRNAARGEPLRQFAVIFNNAVVHHRYFAVKRQVRMRIRIAGRAVGGPASVANGGDRLGRLRRKLSAQVL